MEHHAVDQFSSETELCENYDVPSVINARNKNVSNDNINLEPPEISNHGKLKEIENYAVHNKNTDLQTNENISSDQLEIFNAKDTTLSNACLSENFETDIAISENLAINANNDKLDAKQVDTEPQVVNTSEDALNNNKTEVDDNQKNFTTEITSHFEIFNQENANQEDIVKSTANILSKPKPSLPSSEITNQYPVNLFHFNLIN